MSIELGFTGKVQDLPIDEYHALPHLSASSCGKLAVSPAHYVLYRASFDAAKSEPLRVGSAVDLMVLEPHLVSRMIPMAPDCAKRSDAEKARWKAFRESIPRGGVEVNAKERAIAERVAANVLSSRLVTEAGMIDGERQTSLFCTIDTDEGPAHLRCRPDVLSEPGRFITDLKSAEQADPAWFSQSAAKFGYYRSAAFYLLVAAKCGSEADEFFLLVGGKSENGGVTAFHYDEEALAQGHREVMRAATIWAKCHRTGEWPGLETLGLNTLSLPKWRLDQE